MTLDIRDLGIGVRHVDYTEAWDLQRTLHDEVAEGRREATVLLLEHAPVYTAGIRTFADERPVDGTPVIDVDRGGKITWHGPGQLVGYPIIRLPEHVRSVDYVRRLEEAVIRALQTLGVECGRIPGRSGAWVADDRGERKLAAIGVRVRRHTTMHGFAINVCPDLAWFDRIVPCGITDAGVTSVEAELGRSLSVHDMATAVVPHLTDLLTDFGPYERTPDVAGPRPDPGAVPRLSVPIAAVEPELRGA
jgi:lipoyl(octanoyl) transferase